MRRPLEDIIEEYDYAVSTFKTFSYNGDNNKDTLLEFQLRFVSLKSDLREWHTKMIEASDRRSDKAATAIKYRIAMAMVRGEYKFQGDEKPMYEKSPSISTAEKYAAATREYKQFLDQRTMYREGLVNVTDLREDIQSFINLIKDRLK